MTIKRIAGAVAACLLGLGGSAVAQNVPWQVFEDPNSPSVCDVVNAAEDELVVIPDLDGATGQLFVVTGSVDLPIPDSFVVLDARAFEPGVADGDVFLADELVGFLVFVEDGDGFRTLWWLSFTGRVISVDGLALSVSETDTFPGDFVDVPCDALPFWDGCLSDAECDDANVCTDDLCDAGECVYLAVSGSCDDGDDCTGLDACSNGVCSGILLPGCEGDAPPVISINFCGNGMAMMMLSTFLGLGVMQFRRGGARAA